MNDLDTLIEMLVDEKGGTKEQYLSLMNKIAHHESKGDPTVKQYDGGPGRGLFQFEEGKARGGKTAANRLMRYLDTKGKSIPKWLKETKNKESIDASKLTPKQQQMLFLGNMREHPTADFSKVWEGEETVEDFWANYHWAGKSEDEYTRRKSFQDSLSNYQKKEFNKDTPTQIPQYKQNKVKVDNTYTNNTPTYKEPQQTTQIPTNTSKYRKDTQVVENKPYLNLDQFDLEQPQPIQKDSLTKFDRLNTADMLLNNQMAMGGMMPNLSRGEFNSFNTGGLHETNPNGGIPLGTGSNGKPNTVEQDETSYEFKEGKYIFSNRLSLDLKSNKKQFDSNQFALGGNTECGGPGQPPCDEIKEMTKSYIKSPKYKERLKSSGYNNIDKEIQYRLNNINNTETIYQNGIPSLLEQIKLKSQNIPYSESGSIYDRKNKKVIIDKKQSKDEGVPIKSIQAHEYAHSELDPNKENYDYRDIGIKSTRLNTYDNLNLKHRIKKEVYEKNSHNSFPDENKADLNAFRYELKDFYDAGTEDFTKEHLKKSKSSIIKKRLLKNYSEEDLIWLMNNIASINNKNNNTKLT